MQLQLLQPRLRIFSERFQLHTTNLGDGICELDSDWERSVRVYRDAGIPTRMNIRQHDVRLCRPLDGTNLILHANNMRTVQVLKLVGAWGQIPTIKFLQQCLQFLIHRRALNDSDVVIYPERNISKVNSAEFFETKESHRWSLVSIMVDCKVEGLAAQACTFHSCANCGTLFYLVEEQTTRGNCFVTVEFRHWRCQTLSTMGCKDLQTVEELNSCLTVKAPLTEWQTDRLCQDYHTIPELEPYLGLRKADADPPPVGRYRNVIFVGWRAEWERRYLDDCEFNPLALFNLIARVDGQTLFKYAFLFERKYSKFTVSYVKSWYYQFRI